MAFNWLTVARTCNEGGHLMDVLLTALQLPDTREGHNNALRCASSSCCPRTMFLHALTLEIGRFLDQNREEYLAARKVIEDDERRERAADATAWMRTQSHKSGKSPRSSTAARHSASEATRSSQEVSSKAWDPASVLQLCVTIDKDRGLSGRRGVHSHDRMLGCIRSAAAIKASTRNAGTLPL